MNNLLVADDSFKEPLVSLWQGPKVRDLLKDPQVTTMDGNVYARRSSSKFAALVFWMPAQNERGDALFSSVDELRKAYPQFEAKSQYYPDYWGPLFPSPELRRLELVKAFPGANGGVALPANIRSLLRWPESTATFPGAYAPR